MAALVACGGSSGIDLFNNPDAGGGNDGSASASSSGSSGSADGGGQREGGLTGTTRPGGDTKSIPCGAGSCALATEVCCVTSTGESCLAGATCPAPPGGGGGGDNPSVTLKCTSAANCGPGTMCCVTRTDTAVTATCEASCNSDQAQLCDPTAANTGCSPSQPCSSDNIREWRLPRTFATCGGKGD